MMTAWRLLPGCQTCQGICARPWMRQSTCSCIGNCIAAQQQGTGFTCSKGWHSSSPLGRPEAQVPWASRVWPVQPSPGGHGLLSFQDDAMSVIEGLHHPSDMVPHADAKMQIPSCQMRFGAGWPGYFYERWVRS